MYSLGSIESSLISIQEFIGYLSIDARLTNDLVILRSTVPIGITRNEVLPVLEKISGLKAGEEFFLSFCPERTAEGRALEELKKLPQIIGGYCTKSAELALRFFNEYTHTVI